MEGKRVVGKRGASHDDDDDDDDDDGDGMRPFYLQLFYLPSLLPTDSR